MIKIQGYSLTLAGLLVVPYVAAPLVKEDFNVSDAPEAPPTASIMLATTAVAEVQFNNLSDELIEVAAPIPVTSALIRST